MAVPDTTLTDQIYEASIIPEYWPKTCDMIASMVGGFSASIITSDLHSNYRWVSSGCVQDDMERFSKKAFEYRNVRFERHVEQQPFSFARDVDMMTSQELEEDGIYNDFLRPIGIGSTMGHVVQEPSGHLIIFDILRRDTVGGFTPEDVGTMNAVKADLARAALMSSRLAFKEAENITKTLESLGLPALVVGERGLVISHNSLLATLGTRVRIGARDRMSLSDSRSDKILQACLDELSIVSVAPTQSIPVAATEDAPPLVIHILPVKRDARDIFAKASYVLIFTTVGTTRAPDLRVLSGLFDLTPGEAKVAREVAMGHSLDEISRRTNLTLSSVRTYLKLIFSKTGVTRQAELATLLVGTSL